MREIPKEKILIYLLGIGAVAAIAPFVHRIPRTSGNTWYWHPIFLVVSFACVLGIPSEIKHEIFSPGGVVVIGTLLPVYESIVAVCTITADDDRAWLQYWIAAASFSFATEFMDDITQILPAAGAHWYEFEFFFLLWLWWPSTDGAGFLYRYITLPFLAPVARRLKRRCEGYIGILLTIVNSSYIYILWFVFLRLPEAARRFVVIALGTVYPIAASTVALTTQDSSQDDTTWLTYWSAFSLLFLAMDYLENFVGSIPGFYSLCAVATVYLFLPMFQGAEVVLRRVLVPLSGQYEAMLLRDAYRVRESMLKSVPASQRERVMRKTADLFTKFKET